MWNVNKILLKSTFDIVLVIVMVIVMIMVLVMVIVMVIVMIMVIVMVMYVNPSIFININIYVCMYVTLRYLHYYHRYTAHEQSLKLESVIKAKVGFMTKAKC